MSNVPKKGKRKGERKPNKASQGGSGKAKEKEAHKKLVEAFEDKENEYLQMGARRLRTLSKKLKQTEAIEDKLRRDEPVQPEELIPVNNKPQTESCIQELEGLLYRFKEHAYQEKQKSSRLEEESRREAERRNKQKKKEQEKLEEKERLEALSRPTASTQTSNDSALDSALELLVISQFLSGLTESDLEFLCSQLRPENPPVPPLTSDDLHAVRRMAASLRGDPLTGDSPSTVFTRSRQSWDAFCSQSPDFVAGTSVSHSRVWDTIQVLRGSPFFSEGLPRRPQPIASPIHQPQPIGSPRNQSQVPVVATSEPQTVTRQAAATSAASERAREHGAPHGRSDQSLADHRDHRADRVDHHRSEDPISASAGVAGQPQLNEMMRSHTGGLVEVGSRLILSNPSQQQSQQQPSQQSHSERADFQQTASSVPAGQSALNAIKFTVPDAVSHSHTHSQLNPSLEARSSPRTGPLTAPSRLSPALAPSQVPLGSPKLGPGNKLAPQSQFLSPSHTHSSLPGSLSASQQATLATFSATGASAELTSGGLSSGGLSSGVLSSGAQGGPSLEDTWTAKQERDTEVSQHIQKVDQSTNVVNPNTYSDLSWEHTGDSSPSQGDSSNPWVTHEKEKLQQQSDQSQNLPATGVSDSQQQTSSGGLAPPSSVDPSAPSAGHGSEPQAPVQSQQPPTQLSQPQTASQSQLSQHNVQLGPAADQTHTQAGAGPAGQPEAIAGAGGAQGAPGVSGGPGGAPGGPTSSQAATYRPPVRNAWGTGGYHHVQQTPWQHAQVSHHVLPTQPPVNHQALSQQHLQQQHAQQHHAAMLAASPGQLPAGAVVDQRYAQQRAGPSNRGRNPRGRYRRGRGSGGSHQRGTRGQRGFSRGRGGNQRGRRGQQAQHTHRGGMSSGMNTYTPQGVPQGVTHQHQPPLAQVPQGVPQAVGGVGGVSGVSGVGAPQPAAFVPQQQTHTQPAQSQSFSAGVPAGVPVV